MYRHGDVLLAPVDRIPENAVRRPGSVLARGEATGHSHRMQDAQSGTLFDADGVGYLSVSANSALLIHDASSDHDDRFTASLDRPYQPLSGPHHLRRLVRVLVPQRFVARGLIFSVGMTSSFATTWYRSPTRPT